MAPHECVYREVKNPIKIFEYINELGCFVVHPEYKKFAEELGLKEWNEVVWIGRYIVLDNDFGEHWFDNWPERDLIVEKAEKMGIEYHDLLIVDPERFKNGADGPCHTDEERKRFWTDVLKSLHLSLETLIAEALKENQRRDPNDEGFIKDLDDRIKRYRS